jgi:hypothetical protein
MKGDLSGAVVRAIQPVVEMPPRWQWAVVFQFALSGLILLLTIPVILASEGYQTLAQFLPSDSTGFQSILELILPIEVFIRELTQSMVLEIQHLQFPNLPVGLVTVIPILLTTGILWLVGNGLLLRKQTRLN